MQWGFSDRCETVVSNLSAILAPIVATTNRGQNGEGRQLQNPSSIACSSAVESIRSVKNWFLKVNESLVAADEYSKTKLAEKEAKTASLEKLVFSKEKERLGALALVSSESRGWLRYGAPRQSGQRSMIACMLLPQWAILRRSLIILYEGPTLDRVVNMVSLVGATMHALEGGQRIYDVKRAFAIVDASGCTHCLSVSTDLEFVTWVSAIQNAIKVASVASVEVETANKPADTLETSEQSETRTQASSVSSSDLAVSEVPAERKNSEQSTSLGTARNLSLDTVHESPDQSEATQEIAPNDGSYPPEQGKQLRNRFAGVSQATKRGFGSARQATKNRLGSGAASCKAKRKRSRKATPTERGQ